MYKLVTAVVLLAKDSDGLNELDVSKMTVAELLSDYSLGYLVLTHTSDPEESFLTLEVMRSNQVTRPVSTVTVSAWLSTYKGYLPTTRKEPEFKFSKLRYVDAHQGGFVKSAVHPSSTLDGYPLSELDDLYVYKDGIDGDILNDNCVFTINGYLHNHSRFRNGIKVSHGTNTILHSQSNQAGLLSFQSCGGVERVDIKVEMVSKMDENLPYFNESVIKTGVDLRNKSIILSFAGMMFFDSDVLNVSSAEEGVIIFNPSIMELAEKLLEASRFVHMDMLDYADKDLRLNTMDHTIIKTDAFMKSLFGLPQTFLMVIDKPIMTVKRTQLPWRGILGLYHNSEYDNEIVINEYSDIIPYFHSTGNKHPYLKDQHFYHIPHNRCEYVTKAMGTTNYKEFKLLNRESLTFANVATKLQRLHIEFIQPA